MEWEYQRHHNYPTFLIIKTEELLELIASEHFDVAEIMTDTRSVHKHLFLELTPQGYEHFAGHYRGESFVELSNYQIAKLPGALKDCCPAQKVPSTMIRFGELIKKGISRLDTLVANGSPEDSLFKIIKFACDVCVEFCKIHPYANGNGHISRFLIIAILRRYGYVVDHFYIDPRPLDRSYISCMVEYSRGNKLPLMHWLSKLVKTSPI